MKTERFFCAKNRLLKVLKNEFIARKGLAPLPRVFIFEILEGGGHAKTLATLEFNAFQCPFSHLQPAHLADIKTRESAIFGRVLCPFVLNIVCQLDDPAV